MSVSDALDRLESVAEVTGRVLRLQVEHIAALKAALKDLMECGDFSTACPTCDDCPECKGARRVMCDEYQNAKDLLKEANNDTTTT